MTVTKEQLLAIMPTAKKRTDAWLAPLNAAMEEFEINTPMRQAAFLAQIAHESGELRYVRELASGEEYDTGRKAKMLGNTPEADGDGQTYIGRGPIQLTGVDNYRACGKALGLPLIDMPEILEQPEHGCRAAGWFWTKLKKLNRWADIGDLEYITKRINGGMTHFKERFAYYCRAKAALGIQPQGSLA